MTEVEIMNEKLEQENKELRKELEHYKNLYAAEREKKIDMEEKLELAKETARKGLDASKDIFKVTKSVFGKAKDSLKEEWDKQRTTERKEEPPKDI